MEKFNFHKLFIKLTSQSMWAWLISNAITFVMCWRDGDYKWLQYMVVGNIIITCLFIGGKVIIDALAAFVSKGNLNVEIKK